LAARSSDTPWRSRAWAPWLPVALWITVIAALGSSGFQHEQTSRFLAPLLRWLLSDWSDAQVAALHGWIRKGAHVTEYAIAAVLTFRALWLSGRATTRAAAALPILALTVAVAVVDEARQARVKTRTGSPRDVALDVAGGALGLAIAPWVVPWLGGQRRAPRREPASRA